MTKTLGKLESKVLRSLQAKSRSIFGLKDALTITKTGYDATRLLVGSLVHKGWLIRIKRGKYLITSLEEEANTLKNWYLVAASLIEPYPYYFSHYTALHLHNMVTQPLRIIYVSTSKRAASRTILKTEFRFIYCRPKKMRGIEEKWVDKQNKIKISGLEKTIVDALSRPDLCGGISEIAKGIWIKRNEIDYAQLLGLAEQTGTGAVKKRIGFILELYKLGTPKLHREFKKAPGSISLLDPTLPKKGFISKEWKLFINSDPQELKKIIWT